MAPFLPVDCLSQIFQNLEKDPRSLYSCILVNRLWCATSIEYLWSRPFHFLYTCADSCTCDELTRIQRSSKLIRVYLSCLNEKEKILLMESRVHLPSSAQQSPLFDYAGFIRCLDLDEFYMAVRDWIESAHVVSKEEKVHEAIKLRKRSKRLGKKLKLSTVVKFLTKPIRYHNKRKFQSDGESVNSVSTGTSSTSGSYNPPPSPAFPHPRERLITEFLCKLLMRRCTALKQLSIDKNDLTKTEGSRCASLPPLVDIRFNNHRFIPDQYLSLPTYPGAVNCLSYLSELICTTRQSKIRLFDSLSEICHQIHTIVVNMNFHRDHVNRRCGVHSSQETTELEEEAKSLANLIKAQNNLQNFELYRCEAGFPIIIQSLQTQSKSLRSLCFDYLRYVDWESLTMLTDCVNLQKLEFRSCSGLISETLGPFNFRNLSTILMDDSSASSHILDAMIKSSAHNIRTLKLVRFNDGKLNDPSSIQVIKTVAKYCPNLTTFSSNIYNSDEIDHLIALFTLCTKLSSVTITGPYSEIDVDKMFLQLAHQDLSNLKELNMGSLSFTPESLRQFLMYSKAPIRSLSIDDCRFTDDHLEVVIRSLRNTLKVLRLRLLTNHRLSEESINYAKGCIEDFDYDHKLSNNENHNGGDSIFKNKFYEKYLTEKRLIRLIR